MDRIFEKYDLIAYFTKNDQKSLNRTKEIHAYNSRLSNMNLLNEEFDLDVRKILTRKQSHISLFRTSQSNIGLETLKKIHKNQTNCFL